jgi:gamma-glutamyl hydrolase
VNGVLLPGGILEAEQAVYERYFATVQYIFDWTVERNRLGDPFVLWGTCQGFELINAAAARSLSVVLPGFSGMDPLMMRVNLTQFANASRLWGSAPPNIIDAITRHNTTLNWHSKGITPAEYAANIGNLSSLLRPLSSLLRPLSSLLRPLSSLLRPLSTTNDVSGRTFVSSLEGISSEIYATQFHPERPPYEFDNDFIGHEPMAIQVSNFLSLFLRQRLMRNNHTFESPDAAERLLIENYPVSNEGWGVQVYYV